MELAGQLDAKHEKLNKYFMQIAKLTAENSYAKRSKVGAVMVRDGRIISIGWNGQPSGWDNACEEEVLDENGNRVLRTLPTVVHAEVNAIYWCSKSEIVSNEATMYLTLSPCAHCALAMIQAGIREVYYLEEYHDKTGLEILKKSNIRVKQITL